MKKKLIRNIGIAVIALVFIIAMIKPDNSYYEYEWAPEQLHENLSKDVTLQVEVRLVDKVSYVFVTARDEETGEEKADFFDGSGSCQMIYQIDGTSRYAREQTFEAVYHEEEHCYQTKLEKVDSRKSVRIEAFYFAEDGSIYASGGESPVYHNEPKWYEYLFL